MNIFFRKQIKNEQLTLKLNLFESNIVFGPGFDGGRFCCWDCCCCCSCCGSDVFALNKFDDISAVVDAVENGSEPKASENGSIPSKLADEIVVEETFNLF